MGWLTGFIAVIGIGLYIFLNEYAVSDNTRTILLSIIVGIGVYLFAMSISWIGIIIMKIRRKDDKSLPERLKRRKKRSYIIAFSLMILSIVLFFNFYLYIKTLMGNDMLISLRVGEDNFFIKNGEVMQLEVDARVLTNPFCSANCSLSIEDMGRGEIVHKEDFHLKFSSPFYNNYPIVSNEENSGQTLYEVSLECNTLNQKFCYTKDSSKSRTKILLLNHELNDLQVQRKEELKKEVENLTKEFYTLQNNLNKMNLNFSSLDLSEFETENQYLRKTSYSLIGDANNLGSLYKNQEYPQLEASAYDFRVKIDNLVFRFNNLNFSVTYKLERYNSLVHNASLMRDEIFYLEESNFSDSSISEARDFVRDFNSMILSVSEKNKLESKIILFNNVRLEKESLFSLLKNESYSNISGDNVLDVSIYPVNIWEPYDSSFILQEPFPICCLRGECYKCMDNSSSNYPVVLVHGHSFNEKISAELSMESFGDVAQELEKEGYIDAGYFYVSDYEQSLKGYLGKVDAPVVVEATYYLDTQVTEENSFIFDSKWESIDIYAARLNEIISNVKYITGKEKVVIVAHSMGGLVTRRYIQLYGEESLDKIILVGTPNKGIDGFVLAYCPVFGADIECSEMNKSSSFMSELNTGPLPNIPFYNIIGLGCSWEDSDGDGIVKNESAYLEGVENIYTVGNCNGVDFFHLTIINPNKHPEVYYIIKNLIVS
jgi:pimeloyl-ACP methyl ester carboxylesterase